jgi:hypothetical protein
MTELGLVLHVPSVSYQVSRIKCLASKVSTTAFRKAISMCGGQDRANYAVIHGLHMRHTFASYMKSGIMW